MPSNSIRRILDIALAVWGALVFFRFVAPELGIAAVAIDRTGLQVVLPGLCLALAAADAALDYRDKQHS